MAGCIFASNADRNAPIRERVFGLITTPRQSLVWLVSATDQSACELSQPMSALFDIECWTVKICEKCCKKLIKFSNLANLSEIGSLSAKPAILNGV